MSCIGDCKSCSSRDASDVQIINPSYPTSAVTPGDNVTISFVIQNNGINTGDVDVCVYDRDTGDCIDGMTIFMYPYTNSDTKSFTFIMPSKNWHLKLSVVNPPLLIFDSSQCNDFKDFKIDAKFPAGSKFNCYNGSCVQNDNCTGVNCYSESTCANQCVPNPGPCPSDKFNILGQCFAKNDVYIGVGIIALFMLLRK